MELENRMVSEQLDLYIITDDIIASLIQAQVGQIARDEVKLCTLVQEAYDNFVQQIVKFDLQEIPVDVFVETKLMPRVAYAIIDDVVSKHSIYFNQKCLMNQERVRKELTSLSQSLYEDFLERETKIVLKAELELEYYARNILDELLKSESLKETQTQCLEYQISVETIQELHLTILEQEVKAIAEEVQAQEDEKLMIEEIGESQIQSVLKDEIKDEIAEAMVSETLARLMIDELIIDSTQLCLVEEEEALQNDAESIFKIMIKKLL